MVREAEDEVRKAEEGKGFEAGRKSREVEEGNGLSQRVKSCHMIPSVKVVTLKL